MFIGRVGKGAFAPCPPFHASNAVGGHASLCPPYDFAHPTALDHPCAACSSAKIASPIWLVDTAVVPSDLISAVRRPLASTAAIAASSLSASAPMSNE